MGIMHSEISYRTIHLPKGGLSRTPMHQDHTIDDDDWKHLTTLQPGWLDGTGHAIDKDTIDTLKDLLSTVQPPPTSITPTPEGGIDVMWMCGDELVATATLLPDKQFFLTRHQKGNDVCTRMWQLDDDDRSYIIDHVKEIVSIQK